MKCSLFFVVVDNRSEMLTLKKSYPKPIPAYIIDEPEDHYTQYFFSVFLLISNDVFSHGSFCECGAVLHLGVICGK